MTFYSNVKQRSYVLNPKGKALYEGEYDRIIETWTSE